MICLYSKVISPFALVALMFFSMHPCKGILLYGPPGTGKTMLAKAVAKDADASFINISMSSITLKWLGVADNYVKAVFSLAKKNSPCVIFMDEVDRLLGQIKKSGGTAGHGGDKRRIHETLGPSIGKGEGPCSVNWSHKSTF